MRLLDADGCEDGGASCFACRLPECVWEPWRARFPSRQAKVYRRAVSIAAARDAGLDNDALVAAFGVSKRTIARALESARKAG